MDPALFNDAFHTVGPPRRKRDPMFPEPIDLTQLRAEAVAAIGAEMDPAVNLAKAEARALIGERDSGYAVMGRHAWQPGCGRH